ncbi:MAG: DUF6106 family protein [Coprococcus sp.]
MSPDLAAMFVQGWRYWILKGAIAVLCIGICFQKRDGYDNNGNEMNIARIIAKKSRKKIMSFSNADVKFIAKEGCIYLDNELQQDSSIKTRDFTSGNKQNQDGVYVFVLNKNGKAEFVKLELSDRTIDHVNNFFRGKYKE